MAAMGRSFNGTGMSRGNMMEIVPEEKERGKHLRNSANTL